MKYGSYNYPCGHTRRHLPEKIEKLQRERPERCFDCDRDRGAAELAAVLKTGTVKTKAASLATSIAIPGAVPAPLAQEWRWWAKNELVYAIAAERALGKNGATGDALERATAVLARIAVIMDDPRAAADRGVLQLTGQAHWATGWVHLACAQPHPVGQGELDDAVSLITQLTRGYEGFLPPGADTRSITKMLTVMITELPNRIETKYKSEDRYLVYRELKLPVVPDGKSRYGRLDVVIWHPSRVEVVVEIDSAANPSSAQKLTYARDAGAAAVWVRFGSGGITAPEGVAVIDLR